MTKKYFLGVDQGSSATKALVVDEQGGSCETFIVPVGVNYISDERVEQDPNELFESVTDVIQQGFNWVEREGGEVAGIGMAFQRSGVCAWDEASGEVRSPLLTWQDTRTKSVLDSLGDKISIISKRAGVPATPHYAGGKLSVLQRQLPEESILIGTLDSFILYGLTNGEVFATEDTMAQRTMLYDILKSDWDSELCAMFRVDRGRLPVVNPSLFVHGHYRGVPIAAMLGDQQSALLSRCTSESFDLLNLGTIGSLSVGTGNSVRMEPGYITNVFWSEDDRTDPKVRHFQYVVEATVNACGRVIRLLERMRKERGITESLNDLCGQNGLRDPETLPVAFLPIGGTACPDFRYDLPCVVENWDRDNFADFAVAAVESIGGFVASNILAFREFGLLPNVPHQLLVAGGISQLDYLVQYLASVTDYSMAISDEQEATARGAALGAMRLLGAIDEFRSVNTMAPAKVMDPMVSHSKRRFAMWRELQMRIVAGERDPNIVLDVDSL